ncbi:thiamine pyrophosphate-dependent enzyme [Caldinitratiruptor microaerophilus]|uniref:Thiamine pyrophosphate enzyme TPP-binding domain-containing protein n=1 Tax=Caldinitratiruptor microaerophilus TaxID=671077 RepID=A0AA35G6N2_9FIRM|nr:thiamine pyrophosphate-dependent enzyme [Caldinitratiruptor microaerophilus]BDG59196.1 hypothetical protein caldi_02860 [Caldinitratiruptor microaerophilus]
MTEPPDRVSPLLRQHVPIRRPGGYFRTASGGLGWALPAAVGIKLAWQGRPVVAVVGDGSDVTVLMDGRTPTGRGAWRCGSGWPGT